MKYLIIILFSVTLFACGNNAVKEQEQPSAVHEEGETEPQGNMVGLTQVQMETAEIILGSIQMKNLGSSIRANGTLTVPNQNKALVTSVTSGVLNSLRVQPGNAVKKGDLIATIINPDIARPQQELQTVNAQISLAEIELKRQQELVAGNAAPLKNVQRIETELKTFQTTRNSLEKQLSLSGISVSEINKGNIITTIPVRAPITGTVSDVSAQIGSAVDQSTPIAGIVNNSELHLDLFVYERDLSRLSAGQLIHFTLTNNPGKEFDAKIYSIGSAFANESKAIPVHAVVRGNKAGLIEGMSVTALISIGNKSAPAVPTEAIVSAEGQEYIFIKSTDTAGRQKADEHDTKEIQFERVQVIKGASDVGYTEVRFTKDIGPGAQIVTKGAFFVLAKMTNTEGHED